MKDRKKGREIRKAQQEERRLAKENVITSEAQIGDDFEIVSFEAETEIGRDRSGNFTVSTTKEFSDPNELGMHLNLQMIASILGGDIKVKVNEDGSAEAYCLDAE